MIIERNGYKIHISDGNVKMGLIPSFSLLPGCTCSAEACHTCYIDGCYARKMADLRATVRKAWTENTTAARENLQAVESALTGFFTCYAPRFFRLHVGGDFLSHKYAEMWARIAAANPGTRFLAFTKQWNNVRGVSFPSNFSLVLSGWPGTEIPDDLRQLYPCANVYATDAATDASGDWVCPGSCDTCGACWDLAKTGRNVGFTKH